VVRTRLGAVVFAGISALLVVIGSVAPWITISFGAESIGFSGTSFGITGGIVDGTITLVLALVAGACIGFSLLRDDRMFQIFGALFAFATAVIAVIDFCKVADGVYSSHFRGLSIGYGLWITTLGAIAMFVAALKAIPAAPYVRAATRPAVAPPARRSGQPANEPEPQEYWVEDPFGRHQLRWWDGNRYTDKVMDDNVTSSDAPGRRARTAPSAEPATS